MCILRKFLKLILVCYNIYQIYFYLVEISVFINYFEFFFSEFRSISLISLCYNLNDFLLGDFTLVIDILVCSNLNLLTTWEIVDIRVKIPGTFEAKKLEGNLIAF